MVESINVLINQVGGGEVNLPNIITVGRFCLVPILGYYLFKGDYLTSIVIFLFAGLTDIIDGYIARKFNMMTEWGKVADPLADKLIQATVLVMLVINKMFPLPLLIIIFANEILMGLGTLLLFKKVKVVVGANWYGKLATVLFYFAITMIIIIRIVQVHYDFTNLLINIFIVLAVISKLYAFIMYAINYKKIKKLI